MYITYATPCAGISLDRKRLAAWRCLNLDAFLHLTKTEMLALMSAERLPDGPMADGPVMGPVLALLLYMRQTWHLY